MPSCHACGNEYAGAFELRTADGTTYTFDSFECAISTAAPRCAKCAVAIIGHGVAVGGYTYCCAHCARDHHEAGTHAQDSVQA